MLQIPAAVGVTPDWRATARSSMRRTIYRLRMMSQKLFFESLITSGLPL